MNVKSLDRSLNFYSLSKLSTGNLRTQRELYGFYRELYGFYREMYGFYRELDRFCMDLRAYMDL